MGAKQSKAPEGCFWRQGVLFARKRVHGKLHRKSLETDNRALAIQRRNAWLKSLIGATSAWNDGARTFPQAVEAWEKWIIGDRDVRPKTVQRYMVSLGQLLELIGDRPLGQINGRFIRELVEARRARGITNATIKRDLGALSSVMNCAVAREWLEVNPVLPRLRGIKERRDPIRLPLQRDVDLVIERARGMIKDLIRAAIATGAREEELVTARHDAVDHDHRTLTLVGKRNRKRTIELEPFDGYDLISKLPVFAGKPWLFWHSSGENYKNFSSNFAAVVRRTSAWAQEAGVEFRPFRFHDLRHLHAVEYLRGGFGDIYTLSRRLGHTSVKTTEVYLAGGHLSEAQQAAAVGRAA